MSRPIIEVRGLSKKYRLGRIGAASWREEIRRWWGGRAQAQGEFWALDDVSFEVQPGEVLGIIGRNGAGKSTLLKILSRITEPTRGEAVLRGRVASLLEVGTGFHPELTGRENVYLNGAILGMKKREIDARFDEIVAFAEMEKFIDTPVKRYSSGQSVRLGFAVAAHLETEILMVDEVLAVGDVAFQQKCLRRMREMTEAERTVLFVSHNMLAIQKLCTRCILLGKGKVETEGDAATVAERYRAENVQFDAERCWSHSPESRAKAVLTRVRLENMSGEKNSLFLAREPWQLRVEFEVRSLVRNGILAVGIQTADHIPVRTVWSTASEWTPGRYHAVFSEPWLELAPGQYFLCVGLSEYERPLQYDESMVLQIADATVGEAPVRYQGCGLVINTSRLVVHSGIGGEQN